MIFAPQKPGFNFEIYPPCPICDHHYPVLSASFCLKTRTSRELVKKADAALYHVAGVIADRLRTELVEFLSDGSTVVTVSMGVVTCGENRIQEIGKKLATTDLL
jgi:hypothetical protein